MKKLTKSQQPDFYAEFIAKYKPELWSDIAPIRTHLRKHILSEQNSQCAYTGLRLSEDNEDSHIDHYKKRSMFPSEQFDYHNLFVSTNREDCGAKYKDKHISKSDYDTLINPRLEDPNDFLEYSFTGNVYSKNNSERGKITIQSFQLNNKFLVKRRKEKIKIFNQYKHLYPLEELIKHLCEFEGMIRNLHNNPI